MSLSLMARVGIFSMERFPGFADKFPHQGEQVSVSILQNKPLIHEYPSGPPCRIALDINCRTILVSPFRRAALKGQIFGLSPVKIIKFHFRITGPNPAALAL